VNLLVTGGCGFIGSHFVRAALRYSPDITVINLDKLTYAARPGNLSDVAQENKGTRYHFVEGDICDAALVASVLSGYRPSVVDRPILPDWIVNFAAESHVDRSIEDSTAFVRSNVMGVHVLLEAARTQGIGTTRGGFLQISTDEVYGALGDDGYFTEDSLVQPNSPYAATKAAAEHLVRSYHKTYGMRVLTVRSANNYGPDQFPEKVIPVMMTKASSNQRLPVYGDGRNVREWLYVEDNCAGILHVLMNGQSGETYNIGGTTEMRNIDLAKMILQKLGKPESLIEMVPDRPGHDWRYAMKSDKVRALGWEPKVSFEEGLDRTIASYADSGQMQASAVKGSGIR
jgi:dTDP-glucose 4,6-dehydratase